MRLRRPDLAFDDPAPPACIRLADDLLDVGAVGALVAHDCFFGGGGGGGAALATGAF
jgi:hypothetical protein